MDAAAETRVKRSYFGWPLRLWRRFQVDGCGRIDPPAEWPREPCWLWQGGKNGDRRKGDRIWMQGGYGYIRGPDGKMERVHVLAFRELRGPIDDDKIHRHSCDAHDCGNPWHIEPGTVAENNGDTYARGRRNGRQGGGTNGDRRAEA